MKRIKRAELKNTYGYQVHGFTVKVWDGEEVIAERLLNFDFSRGNKAYITLVRVRYYLNGKDCKLVRV